MSRPGIERTEQPAIAVELQVRDLAIVELRGEHDLAGKAELNEALGAASDRANVLVDLSACTFVDSTVIALLLSAGKQTDERGGRFELVISPETGAVHRIATLIGLESLLPIHETRADALASLAPVEHVVQVRDLRRRFGDPEAWAARCACGWSGDEHTGVAAERDARRDGRRHTEQERDAGR